MFTPHDALVTGGAGFIGCNLAAQLLADGCTVTVLDNLSRAGARDNLRWLDGLPARGRLRVEARDIRDAAAVRALVEQADVVYHLAAQVAVTTSVEHPLPDFAVNALGTLHVLDAARLAARRPVVLYASTNKVYGDLSHLPVERTPTRYRFAGRDGVCEADPLDLKTPYGLSKGAGDLYCLEYARLYGLRTVVFRQSCIYGPRQTGSEEQGWVAWFVKRARTGQPVTIYGDGLQVRDLLHVHDLVRCYALALDAVSVTAGQAYNIGGGPQQAVSVWAEFKEHLRRIAPLPPVEYAAWRPSDQRVYVSDTGKAQRDFGWAPQIPITLE